jgi:hypothetical protein
VPDRALLARGAIRGKRRRWNARQQLGRFNAKPTRQSCDCSDTGITLAALDSADTREVDAATVGERFLSQASFDP